MTIQIENAGDGVLGDCESGGQCREKLCTGRIGWSRDLYREGGWFLPLTGSTRAREVEVCTGEGVLSPGEE